MKRNPFVRLSPLEFTTVYSAECPLLAPWIMCIQVTAKPELYICMKSITINNVLSSEGFKSDLIYPE